MSLSPSDFQYVAGLAKSGAAIVLEPGKEYLVESRLEPVARAAGFPSIGKLIEGLRAPAGRQLHGKVLDALTTNETFFFRDIHPFETLRTHILPQLIEQRAATRRLTIWSAAASTGQEAYSIAMVIREHFPALKQWTVRIMGTDLSPTVLAQAREGRYSQLEVNRGLPAALLAKYFTRQGNSWVANEELRKMTEFTEMNLAQAWPMMPSLDIIFIRNVMIYFDVETKRSILRRARACMHQHSHLFLGTAETTMNIDPHWESVSYGSTVAYKARSGTQ